MYISIMSFLFILIFILALLINGIYEIVFYIIAGILLYNIAMKVKGNKFKNYRKMVIGLVIGYLVGIIILINSGHKITYDTSENLDIIENRTAIILLFDVDLSKYSPSFLIKNFKDSNLIFNIYKLPFNLYKEKISTSKYDQNMNLYYSQSILEQLQDKVDENFIVYRSYLNQSPYIEESIQEAIADGCKEIIITPVSLVGTKEIELQYNKIQNIRLNTPNIEFKFTDYLWNSELIAQSYLDKINFNFKAIDKTRVGIILIGEKFQGKVANDSYIKQDTLFRKKVSDLLKKDGYDNNKIKLSFLNKKEIEKNINSLMEYGVGQIMIVHVSNESQKNSALHTARGSIKSVDAPKGIMFTQIYGWNPDDYLIIELFKKIELVKYKMIE